MSHQITKGRWSATVPDLGDQSDVPASFTQNTTDLLNNLVTLEGLVTTAPGCIAYQDATRGLVAHAGTMAVLWKVKVGQDPDAMVNTGTGAITLKKAGVWSLKACTTWAINATGGRVMWFGRTASDLSIGRIALPAVANGITEVNLSIDEKFAANEQISVFVSQSSGGPLELTGATYPMRFTAAWLRP